MLVARARYYLGLAHEANNDPKQAREAYARVVSGWPKGTKSRTVRWAGVRLEALGK